MVVKIKRIDKSLPLPTYQTKGSVGCDLIARVTTKVKSKTLAKIPLNVIIETPPGFMFLVSFRSSTPFKKNILAPSDVGIGDQDFCGPNDEYNLSVYNFSDYEVIIEKGERIAQGIFVPVEVVQWEEVDSMEHNKTRGGFGSTGGHK